MSDTIGGGSGIGSLLNGPRPTRSRMAGASGAPANLADLLERVLDKGVVIAGDITLCLGEIELLQLKIRLLIASVDKAREMGIDWWQHDPALCSAAKGKKVERDELTDRLDRLEALLTAGDRKPQPVVSNAEAAIPAATCP